MGNWQVLFREVRNRVRAGEPWTEGLKHAVAVAGNNSHVFDDSGYWSRVASHDFRNAWGTVVDWAWEGLGNFGTERDRDLADSPSWEVALLSLGDCPEIFKLYSPGGQSLMDEQKVRDLVLGNELFECPQLDACFTTAVEDPYQLLFRNSTEWVYHNVRELDDDILTWNKRATDLRYHGDNGYFLWLLLGSLAMMAPLADPSYCKSVLQGRHRMYLLSGFESLFSYLATVTPEGIQFETISPPDHL